jgi:CRP/FNR family transcriptional regulator, cyclic AMP receptor protein
MWAKITKLPITKNDKMDERYNYRDTASDIQELINITPIFRGIPEESLQQVTSHAVTRTHPPNQVILLENDWGGSVYFILEGWVKIRTYNVDGKEITLNIIGKGEVFGEMAALDEVPRSTDVITLTLTKISSIPSQDFLTLINNVPLAGVRLAQLMATRLRQVNRRLRLREADSMSRVVDTIIFLAEGQGKQGKDGVEIPNLPHRELSSLSGLARETVTRVLTKLEKKGLIHRDQNVMCLPDIQALEKIIN